MVGPHPPLCAHAIPLTRLLLLLCAAGAQPDYSQAWIEYYRSLGMFREAEMIEQQTRGNQGQQVRMPCLLAPFLAAAAPC